MLCASFQLAAGRGCRGSDCARPRCLQVKRQIEEHLGGKLEAGGGTVADVLIDQMTVPLDDVHTTLRELRKSEALAEDEVGLRRRHSLRRRAAFDRAPIRPNCATCNNLILPLIVQAASVEGSLTGLAQGMGCVFYGPAAAGGAPPGPRSLLHYSTGLGFGLQFVSVDPQDCTELMDLQLGGSLEEVRGCM
jgi:hypothetical protein